MKAEVVPVRLISPASVRWVVESDCVLVVDERRGVAHTLRGPEMAVWNWLALNYTYSQVADWLARSLAVAPAEAEVRLGAIVQGWRAAGLLEPHESTDG